MVSGGVKLTSVSCLLLCLGCFGRPLTIFGLSYEGSLMTDMLAHLEREIEAEFGLKVEYQMLGDVITDNVVESSKNMLQPGSSHPADIVLLDCIYTGELQDLLAPLDEAGVSDEILSAIETSALESFRSEQGHVIALPWFSSFGHLYYRSDLLAKYNFSLPTPAGWTYDEFEEIARTVQEGEKTQDGLFEGFVWPGKDYEGLTCFALEVVAGHGGKILEPNGSVAVNSQAVTNALERMIRWIKGDPSANVTAISALTNVQYQESDITRRFCTEANAMFARNWNGMTSDCNKAGLSSQFGVVRNPGVTRGRGRGAFGPQALSIAKNTPYMKAAVKFLEMALAYDWQLLRQTELGALSARQDIANNASHCSNDHRETCRVDLSVVSSKFNIRFGQYLKSEQQHVVIGIESGVCPPEQGPLATFCDVNVTDYVVSRPSMMARARYIEVSKEFFTEVHKALKHGPTGALLMKHVEAMECGMVRAMGQIVNHCVKTCREGAYVDRRSGECHQCPDGRFLASVPVINATTESEKVVFQSGTPHGFLSGQAVFFRHAEDWPVLHGRVFTLGVESPSRFWLRNSRGEPLLDRSIRDFPSSSQFRAQSVYSCHACGPGKATFEEGSTVCRQCPTDSSMYALAGECIHCPLLMSPNKLMTQCLPSLEKVLVAFTIFTLVFVWAVACCCWYVVHIEDVTLERLSASPGPRVLHKSASLASVQSEDVGANLFVVIHTRHPHGVRAFSHSIPRATFHGTNQPRLESYTDDLEGPGVWIHRIDKFRHGSMLKAVRHFALQVARDLMRPRGLSQSYRVRHLSANRLLLLDANGQPISASLATSSGAIVIPAIDSLLTTGAKFLPLAGIIFVSLSLLLYFARLTFIATDGTASFAYILSPPLFSAAAVFILRGYMAVKLSKNDLARSRELYSSIHSAPQQCTRGVQRGIKISLLENVRYHFRSHIRSRNMYYIDSNITRPLTSKNKLSFAEYLGPKQADWFVSHFWANEFGCFVDSLYHHAKNFEPVTSWDDTAYWVCTFSINQWQIPEELGNHWEESSFYLTLSSGHCKGTAMVIDVSASALARVWCLFEVLQTARMQSLFDNFTGLHLCTSSGVLNKGGGTVEFAFSLSERLSTLRLEDADASVESDKVMIHGLVRAMPGGFAAMNNFVKGQVRDILVLMKKSFNSDFDERMAGLDDQSDLNPDSRAVAIQSL